MQINVLYERLHKNDSWELKLLKKTFFLSVFLHVKSEIKERCQRVTDTKSARGLLRTSFQWRIITILVKSKMPVNICFFTKLATISLLNLINAPNWLLILCYKFSSQRNQMKMFTQQIIYPTSINQSLGAKIVRT